VSNHHHPRHPIIYVRGFAATQSEIEDTVADPYMGFNLGSTKTRTVWTGEIKRFFFESPLVRLMGEEDYDDVFVDGEDLISLEVNPEPVGYQCIVIYRYYDSASEAFGEGKTPPIEHFAKGLSELILRLRKKVCENPDNKVTPEQFRCYLVAHSMGGLVCRAFLQNKDLGDAEARATVDKLFTYATPHNGIDLRIVRNVPGWATFGDADNFNRERMSNYLGLASTNDVSIVKEFPPERIFNLVGTNPLDYRVLGGLSAWAAGDSSDGLVRIQNATTHGPGENGEDISSPRAFVHRSHSGHYGIVNSEEGYQNLTRFLFGDLRVDGILDIDDITLPPELVDQKDAGKLRASYQFEVVVAVRGHQWQMHRRKVRENSAIFRRWQELFTKDADGNLVPIRANSPHLFSVFLDRSKSVKRKTTKKEDPTASVSFAVDLSVLVPDYEVDGAFFLKKHYEGGFIYRQLILVEAFPDPSAEGGWRIKYGFQEESPNVANKQAKAVPFPDGSGVKFEIEVEQKKRPGISAKLRIEARPWS
jgi:hypothetical protein